MKIYEPSHDVSPIRLTEPAAGWTWWIGKGRVTAAEIESWQLGPDLTDVLAEEEYR